MGCEGPRGFLGRMVYFRGRGCVLHRDSADHIKDKEAPNRDRMAQPDRTRPPNVIDMLVCHCGIYAASGFACVEA